MKKCLYCAELIQDDAKKCKHCGEWLKTEKTNFFDKAKEALEDRKKLKQKEKTAHLFVPTNEKPLVIESITFYPDKLTTSNKQILYSDITCVEFYASSATINFATNITMTFAVFNKNHQNEEERTLIIDEIGEGIIKSNCSTKIKEQLNLAHNLISKLTLQRRALTYVQSLKENGYFWYKSKYSHKNTYKFHSNGDLEYNEGIIANIKSENEIDRLVWMPSHSGYNSSSFNPYQFSIKNNNAKWYQVLSKTENIFTIFDKDVFDPLMLIFLKTGSFIPEREIEKNENKVIEEQIEKEKINVNPIDSIKDFPNFSKFILEFEKENNTKLALVDNSIDNLGNKVFGYTQLVFDLNNKPKYIFKFLFVYSTLIKEISFSGFLIPWDNPKIETKMEDIVSIQTGSKIDLAINSYKTLLFDLFEKTMKKKGLNLDCYTLKMK